MVGYDAVRVDVGIHLRQLLNQCTHEKGRQEYGVSGPLCHQQTRFVCEGMVDGTNGIYALPHKTRIPIRVRVRHVKGVIKHGLRRGSECIISNFCRAWDGGSTAIHRVKETEKMGKEGQAIVFIRGKRACLSIWTTLTDHHASVSFPDLGFGPILLYHNETLSPGRKWNNE